MPRSVLIIIVSCQITITTQAWTYNNMLNSRPSSNFHIKFLWIGLSQEAPAVGMMHVESGCVLV